MTSPFLENLKKSVEEGDFNSEAAKKIIEIDKLADIVAPTGGAEANLIKRVEEVGYAESVSEEEAVALNSDYEKEMERIKKQDGVNKQLAILVEIEDIVKLSIEDMLAFIDELDDKFSKEFEEEDPMFADLAQKIEQINSKYNPIINN